MATPHHSSSESSVMSVSTNSGYYKDPQNNPFANLPDNEQERLARSDEFWMLASPEWLEHNGTTFINQVKEDLKLEGVAIATDYHSVKVHYFVQVGYDQKRSAIRKNVLAAHMLGSDEPGVVIEDASKDPRFFNHPQVVENPFIRFFCVVPLKTATGHIFGTLEVFDPRPRTMSEEEEAKMLEFGAQIMASLEPLGGWRSSSPISDHFRNGFEEPSLMPRALTTPRLAQQPEERPRLSRHSVFTTHTVRDPPAPMPSHSRVRRRGPERDEESFPSPQAHPDLVPQPLHPTSQAQSHNDEAFDPDETIKPREQFDPDETLKPREKVSTSSNTSQAKEDQARRNEIRNNGWLEELKDPNTSQERREHLKQALACLEMTAQMNGKTVILQNIPDEVQKERAHIREERRRQRTTQMMEASNELGRKLRAKKEEDEKLRAMQVALWKKEEEEREQRERREKRERKEREEREERELRAKESQTFSRTDSSLSNRNPEVDRQQVSQMSHHSLQRAGTPQRHSYADEWLPTPVDRDEIYRRELEDANGMGISMEEFRRRYHPQFHGNASRDPEDDYSQDFGDFRAPSRSSNASSPRQPNQGSSYGRNASFPRQPKLPRSYGSLSLNLRQQQSQGQLSSYGSMATINSRYENHDDSLVGSMAPSANPSMPQRLRPSPSFNIPAADQSFYQPRPTQVEPAKIPTSILQKITKFAFPKSSAEKAAIKKAKQLAKEANRPRTAEELEEIARREREENHRRQDRERAAIMARNRADALDSQQVMMRSMVETDVNLSNADLRLARARRAEMRAIKEEDELMDE